MSLSTDEVKKIAHLARIGITDEETTQYQSNLTEILSLVDKMSSIDDILETKSPMSHPLDITQRTRDDVVTETNQRDEFQTIAPKTEHGLYLVNQVIE